MKLITIFAQDVNTLGVFYVLLVGLIFLYTVTYNGFRFKH